MHNGNHNMNNIPSLVSNIEQNMEMYGNTNKNNYIPIEQHNMQHNMQHNPQQNMTYNPNIPIQNFQQQLPPQNHYNIPQVNPVINNIEHMDKSEGFFGSFNKTNILKLLKEIIIN